jgi:hypothetical protein
MAILNSYGLAAGNVWTGSNTGTLKSDDLVRASALLRATTAHLEEIGVTPYVNTQLSQPLSATISPDVFSAIGGQFRSYGIVLADADIQKQYSSLGPNTQQQALLYVTKLGVSGFYNQVADSFDLAAKKLRLLEIATACGALLDVLPSSQSSTRAMQASALSPQVSSCNAAATLVDVLGLIGIVTANVVSWPVAVFAGVGWFVGSQVVQYTC